MKHKGHPPLQERTRLWLWGVHACEAALQNQKRQCFQLCVTEGALNALSNPRESIKCKVNLMDGGGLSRLLPEGAVHQGIAMEVAPLPSPPFNILRNADKGVVIVLDQVTDPHNVGAILRTAKALGALGIVMTDRNSPPLEGALAKGASGALDLLPLWKVPNLARALDDLKADGFWTVGLAEEGSQVLAKKDMPAKVALVMGAEGSGLRRLTQEKCDFLVKLPTLPDFSTLNVSVATALALYELERESLLGI